MFKSGKVVATDQEGQEGGAVFVMRPVERAKELFFDCYIHDVETSRMEKSTFVKSKCRASQKKATKYRQKIVVRERAGDCPEDKAEVLFASCEGCVAGTDGGLCSHIIALLMVLDKYRTRKPAATSLPCAWGPRQRNVNPVPIADVVVERTKLDAGRLGDPVSMSLYEARGVDKRTLSQEDIDDLWESLSLDCKMKPLLPSLSSDARHKYLRCVKP